MMDWLILREGVQIVSNVGVLVMLPFVLYILSEVKADVREIKSVNLVSIYDRLSAGDIDRRSLRDRLESVEQLISRIDEEGTRALRRTN